MHMSSKKGFTLIELLIVVVIIGILAAIAIPKFANTKDKAYIAAMKTDLRNLATTEEGYFADNQIYSADTAAMSFAASKNVNIAFGTVGANGWSASATNAAMTNTAYKCTIAVGDQAKALTLNDGVVTCQ